MGLLEKLLRGTACGAQLAAGAKFCAQCGKPRDAG